jgi:hypothetical protein
MTFQVARGLAQAPNELHSQNEGAWVCYSRANGTGSTFRYIFTAPAISFSLEPRLNLQLIEQILQKIKIQRSMITGSISFPMMGR